jgi:hypothetical protein
MNGSPTCALDLSWLLPAKHPAVEAAANPLDSWQALGMVNTLDQLDQCSSILPCTLGSCQVSD